MWDWVNPTSFGLLADVVLIVLVFYHIRHTGSSVRKIHAVNKELGKHVGTVTEKVNELQRNELVYALTSNVENAQRSVIHYTYTFRLPKDEPEMGPLLDAVRQTKVPRDNIRFLGPDYFTDLDRLYLRKKAGAQLRVNHGIKNSDFRFQIADERHVVLSIGMPSEASRIGFSINSLHLAAILTRWFDNEWSRSEDYDAWIRERVRDAANAPLTRDLSERDRLDYVSQRLGLDISEVKRAWAELAKTPSPRSPVPA